MTESPLPHDDIDLLLQRWADAELRGDTTALDDLLAPDFTGVGPLGFVLSRADWLQRHGEQGLVYTSYGYDEVSVQRHPGCTVVVGSTIGTCRVQRSGHDGSPVAGRPGMGGAPGVPAMKLCWVKVTCHPPSVGTSTMPVRSTPGTAWPCQVPSAFSRATTTVHPGCRCTLTSSYP
jgi:hypothetical protein